MAKPPTLSRFSTYYGSLWEGNSFYKLHPSRISKSMTTYITTVVISVGMIALFLRRKLKQKKKLQEAGMALCDAFAQAGITQLPDPAAAELAAGKQAEFFKTYGITNLKTSFPTVYAAGKARREALLKAASGVKKQGKQTEQTEQTVSGASRSLNNILSDIDTKIGAEQLKKQNKAKAKLGFILAGVVLAAVLAVALAVEYVVKPLGEYNRAVSLKNAGNVSEAYAIFKDLGRFKDAREICNSMDYDAAVSATERGNYGEAYARFTDLNTYSDASAKASELLSQYPCLSLLDAKEGDIVVLGTYEQDYDESNGPEPIEWIVLSNHNKTVYAISKYVLDVQPYNTVQGDGSALKVWLKDTFHAAAFADVPASFVSKVGLLSPEDLRRYKETAGVEVEWTKYADNQKHSTGYAAGKTWWLDGVYFHSNGVSMDVVGEHGGLYTGTVTNLDGVRPTITIDVSGSGKDHYAVDRKDMESAGVRNYSPPAYSSSSSGSSSKKSSSSSSKKSSRPCSGGSVGCRAGFHPCHEMSNGYCNQCCAD